MCRIPAGPHHPTPLCQKFTKHPPRNAPNFCCIEFYCSSYCLYHRPTQSVNLIESSGQTCPICLCEIDWNSRTSLAEVPLKTPCCRNSWFHNSCLQVINTGNLNEINLKSVWLPIDWVVDSDLWLKHEPHVRTDGQEVSQGAFQLSELTGQTIPVLMRISLWIKTIRPDQSDPK